MIILRLLAKRFNDSFIYNLVYRRNIDDDLSRGFNHAAYTNVILNYIIIFSMVSIPIYFTLYQVHGLTHGLETFL